MKVIFSLSNNRNDLGISESPTLVSKIGDDMKGDKTVFWDFLDTYLLIFESLTLFLMFKCKCDAK